MHTKAYPRFKCVLWQGKRISHQKLASIKATDLGGNDYYLNV